MKFCIFISKGLITTQVFTVKLGRRLCKDASQDFSDRLYFEIAIGTRFTLLMPIRNTLGTYNYLAPSRALLHVPSHHLAYFTNEEPLHRFWTSN